MSDQTELLNDMERLVQDVFERTRFAKTEMCKDEPMTDTPPLMLVAYDKVTLDGEEVAPFGYEVKDGTTTGYEVAMIPLVHRDDVLDAYEDVVRAMPIRPFSFIVVCVEGYTRSAENMNAEEVQQLSNTERGAMEKDYKENPFTDVREGIIVTAINGDATHISNSFCTYTYDDHGLPTYSEVHHDVQEIKEGQEMGRLMDLLVATCQYMKMAQVMEKFASHLDKFTKKED